MESNIVVIHLGSGIEVFVVLEEWDIVVDDTVALVAAVAVVDAVVVVVASGEIQRRRARMILGVV
jgi:hypothetical protein